MFRRRLLPALLIFTIVLTALVAACSPLGGDDDDDPTNTENAAPRDPTATREIVMSTFTATEVVEPEGQTATAEAQGTAAAATQAARDSLPTPTPANPEVSEEELLWPPRTRLETPDELVEGYLGTYSWQFRDVDETFAEIEAPILLLDQGDPVQLTNGEQLSIRYYGDEYRTPPRQLEVAIYDYESNSATPINPQTGEPAEGEAFAINSEPVQTLRVDPAQPSFTLQGFTPGHYVIWAQGRWGQHPVLDREIFVTWVFDIEIE